MSIQRELRRLSGPVALAALAFLTACGSGSEDSASSSSSVESEAAAPTTAAVAEAEASAETEESDVQTTIEITDIAGRVVEVNYPVKNMILGESRQIYVIAPLEREDPFARIAGWKDDFYRFDNVNYEQYLAKFPEMADIPIFGDPKKGEFSVEQAILLDPDVVILNLGVRTAVEEVGFIDQLAEVGIPVVFIDYRERPMENTIASTQIVGRMLGRETEAEEVVSFYKEKMNRVYDQVASLDPEIERPTVFIERAAGISECCGTWGAESLGELIERAGGTNIAIDIIPGATGTLNPEQVIVSDPDVYMLTGADWSIYKPDGLFASYGNGADAIGIQAQLQGLADRTTHVSLSAVESGRFHGIWHQFYNSPYHFVALEVFAEWIHPDTFDLDAEATFREFHERFLPVDYVGGYWGTLDS